MNKTPTIGHNTINKIKLLSIIFIYCQKFVYLYIYSAF